ncbi:asparagine synthase (glutamine-hydrolyzing) [Stutzerimonas nitrititolerans]|uniref:asparagine synthase (glutamine-hydrolyzing) n=1 Tax=Stutzerimonas nitrititolerans TaxID=2482751 RepID=UPI0028AE711B|nr:asparagine synthase (glutamine-hydrolyzing) [Stutzerimonas nitrititolerans]
MCGIFGYISRSGRSLADAQLHSMGHSINHRGPDDLGVYIEAGVALGNRRLSIMDINGGHQPFVSHDGQIIVVQNGEIFNHIELAAELARDGYPCKTHCDTEVLLRLYERDGIDMVHRLNGMFAIAIFDKRKRALYLIRDRIGVKPLYLHDDGDRLLFGSEIKALLRAGISKTMDPVALHHFLSYNYVPQPRTMFQGIHHLPPGHWLRVDAQGVTTTRWWNLSTQQVEQHSEGEWIEEFNDLLDEAVRLRLRCDVPFGAFLSGGVDSSSVVGVMSRHLHEPVRTYSIGFHEDRYDESPFAAIAAERFGTRHTLSKVDANMLDLWPLATWHCDQPHGDISFLPTYRVAELAAKEVKVVLTGDGADELFAGYDKYASFFGDHSADVMDELAFRQAYYRNLCLFDDLDKRSLYTTAMAARVEGEDSFDVVAPLYEQASGMDRINQALYIDMQLLLSGNNLVKPDRMGMAVSLEARTPFLDYRMMEFAFRMPGNLKLRGGETKYLYKKAVSDLIGNDLAYRRKQMFTVPVGEWFKGPLAAFTEEVLLSSRALERGLFRPNVIRNMLTNHQQGSANYTREIRALIAVELWCRTFLDDDGVNAPTMSTLGIKSNIAYGAR